MHFPKLGITFGHVCMFDCLFGSHLNKEPKQCMTVTACAYFTLFPTRCQIAVGCLADATCLSSLRACRYLYRCTGRTENTLLCGPVAAVLL